MLQIKEICKKYVTGELTQIALDHLSLNLRDNEFVAVLGPSGSGKTTLLNVIGGLDRYDSGDVIINGISTKRYKDRDWDSYRNHTIGFVFQSYNLIPHQTILANVELALTISGISGKERRRRAVEALEKVGLGDQIHKKPSQMSGGQMQRVAIARALVNDPDILLADEPTGALDTQTSLQVMELLKEVASDRLVVMVTHNPELADRYANRIVKVKDGMIIGDTNPYEPETQSDAVVEYKNLGKASMSRRRALALSFNNLATKKGRTFLTAFAGSIGIIGIALILSMANGVNTYIEDIQKSTMSSYPISIDRETMDLTDAVQTHKEPAEKEDSKDDGVYVNTRMLDSLSMLTSSLSENNLTAFKAYLDSPDCPLTAYVGENGIVYDYSTKFSVYSMDENGELIDAGTSDTQTAASGVMSMVSAMSSGSSTGMVVSNAFEQMLPSREGLVSDATKDSYDLLYGSWPSGAEELVLILNDENELGVTFLHQLGLLSEEENQELLDKIETGEDLKLSRDSFSYEEVCEKEYYLIPRCDLYEEDASGHFRLIDPENEPEKLKELTNDAVKLHISGIVRPGEDATVSSNVPVGYTKALTDYVIAHTSESAVVKAQEADPDHNVLTGITFNCSSDAEKAQAAKEYLEGLSEDEQAEVFTSLMKVFMESSAMGSLMSSRMEAMDEKQLAEAAKQYLDTMADEKTLSGIYDYLFDAGAGSYEENMEAFGVVDTASPLSINIYADTFEDKDKITECIAQYNEQAAQEDRIVYTDFVGLLMNSVTTIINTISYVLIAFVAVSLIVSSIMIGIITYISVLERTKEIGILRAIGASKKNISSVFNAETFIIGICSGSLGIGITGLLLLPINKVIHVVANSNDVNAILPVKGAVVLILLSILLTMAGGLIPSRKAARKDPVAALRSE